MTAKGDQTAMLLHCAVGGGTIEATCCNVRSIAPDLAQRLIRVGISFIVEVLDNVNICKVGVHVANALYKCGKCWERILHTHVYRRTSARTHDTRRGCF